MLLSTNCDDATRENRLRDFSCAFPTLRFGKEVSIVAILLKLNRTDFEYDVWTLVRAFYGSTEVLTNPSEIDENSIEFTINVKVTTSKVSVNVSGDKVIELTEKLTDNDRKEVKNILKRTVYRAMMEKSKKELPWGTLTGIRPVKLAVGLMEKDENLSDEDIKSYLKDTYFISDEKLNLSLEIAKNEIELLKDIDYKDGYSLYVGIPFCPSTCLYCSFTSYPISKYKDMTDEYVNALEKEIDYAANEFKFKTLNSVYIGGGTPTTLSAEQLDRLLSKIESSFDMTHSKEFTVEAGRPDSITREKLEVLKKHKVSRISINPQTMKDETLKIIGRHHTVEQIKEAFSLARELGFDNINMDFIVGLPNENVDDVRYTMDETRKLCPDSITIHSLAVKRAARLNMFKDEYKELSIENNQEIMKLTEEVARDMGMVPYYLYRQKNMAGNMENVGYSTPGKMGVYNILIMEEKQTIVALGAGSMTKYVYPDGERIERVENVKNVEQYIERIDEMIDRKRTFFESVKKNIYNEAFKKNDVEAIGDMIESQINEAVEHGIYVSNMAVAIAKKLELPENIVSDLAIAGMLHDIGKIKLDEYMNAEDKGNFVVEQLRYVRMHSKLSYDILKEMDYNNFILESILYHHENFDGSGYPENLKGEDIPLGARILRVCDVFIALTSDRSYRRALDVDTAVQLMIEEVKNFDMEVFLAFMKVVHEVDVNKDIKKLAE